jgi:hypothetical protein
MRKEASKSRIASATLRTGRAASIDRTVVMKKRRTVDHVDDRDRSATASSS